MAAVMAALVTAHNAAYALLGERRIGIPEASESLG
jgi:hypothetical protein